ncbi:MAG: universal stress protein [Gallionellaceae bacterium]|nr:universal stress protein [Gallionellaceae bacterium]
MTLKRILAATDLSAPARHAAARAAGLAAQTGAELELLHVLPAGTLDELRRLFGGESADLGARVIEQARAALHQLAAEVGEPNGVTPAAHLTEGTVLGSIAGRADAIDAGLLVVGAHGASHMRHWLLGATAMRLLRKVRRPLLAVRQVPRGPYRSVLVPVDFSACAMAAVRLAGTLAPDARLTLLHVFQVPFESNLRLAGVEEERIQAHRAAARVDAEVLLRAFTEEAGGAGRWRQVVVHGDAAPRILEQEEEQDADLIVMGKHGAGMTEELLLGSVTKHVLAEARCDVLVVPG